MSQGYCSNIVEFFNNPVTSVHDEADILQNALAAMKAVEMDYGGVMRRANRTCHLMFRHPILNDGEPSDSGKPTQTSTSTPIPTPGKKQKLTESTQTACLATHSDPKSASTGMSQYDFHTLYCIVDAMYDAINDTVSKATSQRRGMPSRRAVIAEILNLRQVLGSMQRNMRRINEQVRQTEYISRVMVCVDAKGALCVQMARTNSVVGTQSFAAVSTHTAAEFVVANVRANNVARAVYTELYSYQYECRQRELYNKRQNDCLTTNPTLHDYHGDILTMGKLQSEYIRAEETHICTIDRQFKVLDYVQALEFIQ